jgi:hypothetical protein
MSPDPDMQQLWQAQPVEPVGLSLDEIRSRASRFHRRIVWRNLREYAAAIILVAILIPHLWRDRGWLLASSAFLIAGVLYVLVQLYRRSARALPAGAAAQTWLDFHCSELARQRDALRTVWSWYLLPMLPGLLMVPIGMSAAGRGLSPILLYIGILTVVFGGVWRLNALAANKLDKQIQDLKEANHG